MKDMFKNRIAKDAAVLVGVMLVLVAAMAFTGQWPGDSNVYATYRLQAQAWLSGRLDLGQDYSWLELAVYDGRYYVSFPPFPSYALLPFCLLFGDQTPDHLIMLLMMLVSVAYAMELYRSVRGSARSMELFVPFLFLSNGYLFIAMRGWVWFFAQSMCFMLSLMALTHAQKGQGGIALTCWACAVGCRPMAAFYLPLLLYLILNAQTGESRSPAVLLKKRWYWAILPALLAVSYMALNVLRFGNPLEFGRAYLPEFSRIQTGQFNLAYAQKNFLELFRLPEMDDESHALVFSQFGGIAFWLVNPMLVTALFAWLYAAVKKRSECRFTLGALPLMILAHLCVVVFHRTLGGWQFGNRYLVDTLPYLFYGIVRWSPDDDGFAALNGPLFYLGFTVNLTGTVAMYAQWI